ncbi:MAG: response regulator receiver domain [Asticcacaulis sp.]|nr:response regulator receiver domain [Asticcacaulis sp.]
MADGAYEQAVRDTFELKPLRTVLMIDDQFPTYSDLMAGDDGSDKFKQKDTALALYKDFRRLHMICDVENDVSDVEADHLRKSDLVILDYNLGPDQSNERSISLLRSLSASKHFNTVVVYTAEPDQDKVWLEIIASLTGHWNTYPDTLQGEALEHWTRLSDEGSLPAATRQATMAFAMRREMDDVVAAEKKSARKELNDLGVPVAVQEEILRAMIHVAISESAGGHAGQAKRKAVGGYRSGVRWIQAHNSFIAILQKQALSEDVPAEDPAGIMAALAQALLSWRPSLFQILISEIQNVLESDALATEELHLGDPEIQTALWYYLLQSLGPLDLSADPDVTVPLMSVIDKIVDGIKKRLSSDRELLRLASDALVGELRDSQWTPATWPAPGTAAMLKAATEFARTPIKVKKPDVLFRLNNFFSTEKFRRSHITTGTVFTDSHANTFWVAASPACDLVARAPSAQQLWSHALHPITAVVAIRLIGEPNLDDALKVAAHGRHVFLDIDGKKMAFALFNDDKQPIYEFIFASNAGNVREADGATVFRAARLLSRAERAKAAEAAAARGTAGGAFDQSEPAAEAAIDALPQAEAVVRANPEDDRELIYENFTVVDQLRGLNATHILQIAGQHLSRVGLDFMKMPSN